MTENLNTQNRPKVGKSNHHLNWKTYFFLPEATSKHDIPWVTFRNSTLVKSLLLLYSCGSKSLISLAGTAKTVILEKFFLMERVNLSFPFQLLLKTFCISQHNTRECTLEKADKELRKN